MTLSMRWINLNTQSVEDMMMNKSGMIAGETNLHLRGIRSAHRKCAGGRMDGSISDRSGLAGRGSGEFGVLGDSCGSPRRNGGVSGPCPH